MNLADYLAAHDVSAAAFARRIGKTRAAVSTWLGGIRVPNKTTMSAIVKATDGKVRPNDFFPPLKKAAAISPAPAPAPAARARKKAVA